MSACDGDLLTFVGETQPGTSRPARADPASARADALRLRAERARDQALALHAWSHTLGRPRTEEAQKDLLTVSPLARLRAQLATMPVIEQAKGILISQQRCDADEAFSLLRQASQRCNVPVRVLAEQIVRGAQQRHQTGPQARPQ